MLERHDGSAPSVPVVEFTATPLDGREGEQNRRRIDRVVLQACTGADAGATFALLIPHVAMGAGSTRVVAPRAGEHDAVLSDASFRSTQFVRLRGVAGVPAPGDRFGAVIGQPRAFPHPPFLAED